MTQMERLLKGYRLFTAEILYRLPDHPHLLQSFIWQDLDLAPRYPVLRRFLDFWQAEIEGKIYAVSLAQRRVIAPHELRHAGFELRVH